MRQGKKLLQRIGRRGAALLFFAMLDIVYAVSLAFPPEEAKLSATFKFIKNVAPLAVWATLWCAIGLVCLVGAFQYRDRWAFTAAMGLKTLWGVTFLLGWILMGLERGYVSAIIWLAMAGWVYIISTWPEPPLRDPLTGAVRQW